jgi:hypothetical protein
VAALLDGRQTNGHRDRYGFALNGNPSGRKARKTQTKKSASAARLRKR